MMIDLQHPREDNAALTPTVIAMRISLDAEISLCDCIIIDAK
jgi:hypothetical protein